MTTKWHESYDRRDRKQQPRDVDHEAANQEEESGRTVSNEVAYGIQGSSRF